MKFCRKCATDQPHPLRHWHAWCPLCRTPKLFRGPSCTRCHTHAIEILMTDQEFLRSLPREQSEKEVADLEHRHDVERGPYEPPASIVHHVYGESRQA